MKTKAKTGKKTKKVKPPKMKWFALAVDNDKSRDDRVVADFKRKLKVEGLHDLVGKVIIPTHKEEEIRNGKSRIINRKSFPGYVIIQMFPDDRLYYLLKDIDGVQTLLPDHFHPTPLDSKEAALIRLREKEKRSEAMTKTRLELEFSIGDLVEILAGAFKGFKGTVTVQKITGDVDPKVTVTVQVMGRDVPVETLHNHVKKVK